MILQKIKNFFGAKSLNNADFQRLMQMMYQHVNGVIVPPAATSATEMITKGYAYNPLVYVVINLRAIAAKGVPWLVYKVTDKKKHKYYKSLSVNNLREKLLYKERSLEEVEGTKLNVLLSKPNAGQTWQDIIEAMFVYRDITGNAYMYFVRNPVTKEIINIHIMPANRVSIVSGGALEPVKGYTLDYQVGDFFEAQNVMHWKYFNPEFTTYGSQLYGLSPLRAAGQIVLQENMAMTAQASAFMNEGLKGIITGTDQTTVEFSPEQAEILQKRFEKHTGVANYRKFSFNRAPLNFVKIGESPVELGILEARKFNKELLCNVFRIHPALISTDASTLNNLTEARKALLTISVLPDLDQLRSMINNNIAASFGDDYYVDYDFMAISELQDDIYKLAQTLKVMDWITINEKRTATNYDAYDDPAADVLYSPLNVMPLGSEMDTGFEKIDAELEKLKHR